MSDNISPQKPDGQNYPVQKTEAQWKEELTDFEYHVL